MAIIENQLLKANINPKGAELTSLYHKTFRLDYLWSGDPAFWAKHSPVLFPIVGTLKNNTYFYKDQPWQLSRHGFARDKQFAIEEQTPDTITFLLEDDEESMAVYPFPFSFRIRYILYEHVLAVTYEVINAGKEEMYFSVGGHPAFKVPYVPGTRYDDYYLVFDQVETALRWPISPAGLIEKTPVSLLQNSNLLMLTKSLFEKDALVLKGITSTKVTLQSDLSDRGFQFDFPGFPYLGLWAAKNADFVCIEPWCGIADNVDTDQQLENKEGINKLMPGETFVRTWTVAFF